MNPIYCIITWYYLKRRGIALKFFYFQKLVTLLQTDKIKRKFYKDFIPNFAKIQKVKFQGCIQSGLQL